jgi:hypothetical protein
MQSVVKEGVASLTKKKPNCLYDIAFKYQNFAVGEKLTRSIWKRPDCYWTITRVVPSSFIRTVTKNNLHLYLYTSRMENHRKTVVQRMEF